MQRIIEYAALSTLMDQFGFDSPHESPITQKLKSIRPSGLTAMRDALMQAMLAFQKINIELKSIGLAEDYQFVHIVLTDGDDNSSKIEMQKILLILGLLNKQVIGDIKTYLIGVDIEKGSQASRELGALAELGG